MAWADNAPVYCISVSNITIVGATTLLAIHTAAEGMGSNIVLCRAWLGQGSTQISNQEVVAITHYTGSTWPTLTARTPAPLLLGGDASGIVGGTSAATAGTAGIDATAEGNGTRADIWTEGFNNLNGWLWLPSEDQYIKVPPDTVVGLRFLQLPSVLTGWSFGLVYIEVN